MLSEKYDLISKFYFEINIRLLDVTMLRIQTLQEFGPSKYKTWHHQNFFWLSFKIRQIGQIKII